MKINNHEQGSIAILAILILPILLFIVFETNELVKKEIRIKKGEMLLSSIIEDIQISYPLTDIDSIIAIYIDQYNIESHSYQDHLNNSFTFTITVDGITLTEKYTLHTIQESAIEKYDVDIFVYECFDIYITDINHQYALYYVTKKIHEYFSEYHTIQPSVFIKRILYGDYQQTSYPPLQETNTSMYNGIQSIFDETTALMPPSPPETGETGIWQCLEHQKNLMINQPENNTTLNVFFSIANIFHNPHPAEPDTSHRYDNQYNFSIALLNQASYDTLDINLSSDDTSLSYLYSIPFTPIVHPLWSQEIEQSLESIIIPTYNIQREYTQWVRDDI